MPSTPVLRPLRFDTYATGAAAAIRDAIDSGHYEPGEHLVERQLAGELGVSTIVVREAFGALAEQGLVTRIPRRGTFVASMSRAALEDITRVRLALEYLAVELAIANWTPEAEARVRSIVTEMERAVESVEIDQIVVLEDRFHETFWEIAGSATLLELAANLRGRISRFLREANTRLRQRELRVVVDIHRDWLAAVASGDLEKARAEVHEQIMITFQRIDTRILASPPTSDGVSVGQSET